MADIKFSEFPKATISKDSDEIAILQDGVNKMIASPVLESKIINKTVSRVIEQGGASLNVINLKGVVPTYADLATITPTPELNDAYQVEADGLVYVYTDAGFQADGDGFVVQPDPIGVVEEGNTQAVSGGEVYDAINGITTITPINLSTPPPEQNGIFQPTETGIYGNFGGLEITQSELESNIVYFYYLDGIFTKQTKGVLTVDEIDSESTNAVNGKAVFNYTNQTINTIADLRLFNGKEGQIITLLGYYESGDKEPLNYVYSTTQGVDDGGAVINSENGSWEAVFRETLNVRDFGASPEIADNTIIFNKVFSFKKPVTIPIGSYVVNGMVDVFNDIYCYGDIVVNDIVNTGSVFRIQTLAFPLVRNINNLKIKGISRAVKKTGIEINSAYVNLNKCTVQYFDIGIVNKFYTVNIINCTSVYNNTNVDMYTVPASGINDVNIIGGNYSSCFGDYSIIIGNEQKTSILTDVQGARILLQGFSFDHATIKVNNLLSVTLDSLYCETPKNGTCIELNKTSSNFCRNIRISNCYLRTAKYGIKTFGIVLGLEVLNNSFRHITYNNLYILTSVQTIVRYEGNTNTSGASLYPRVHTGVGNLSISEMDISLNNYKIDNVGLNLKPFRYGAKVDILNQGSYQTNTRMYGNTYDRDTVINGNVTSNVITVSESSLTELRYLNGGDLISVNGLLGFVLNINYETSTIYISRYFASPVSATLVVFKPIWRKVIYADAIPLSGAFSEGDVIYNTNASLNNIEKWVCLTGGDPGTWKPDYLFEKSIDVSNVGASDATDLATALTLVNELKAKLNAKLTADRNSGQQAT